MLKELALQAKQLAVRQLLQLAFINEFVQFFKVSPGRKAASFRLPRIFSISLSISLRKFKTNKASRTKKQTQLVISTGNLPIKEIALTFYLPKKYKKLLTNYRAQLPPLRLNRPIIPSAMIALGLGGAIYFGFNLSAPRKFVPIVNSLPAPVAKTPAPARPVGLPRSEPVSISIPKIDLSADVVSTGLGANGSIQVPPNPEATGWYSGSPTPGEIGPAVIVGHLDRVGGIAVFWRLRELLPGDTVEITRADSSVATFKVDTVEQYSQANFPTAKVYGNINYAGIRLITCGGTFNTDTRHYSDNTVVYGSLVR